MRCPARTSSNTQRCVTFPSEPAGISIESEASGGSKSSSDVSNGKVEERNRMDDRARDVKSGIVHTELPCEFCAEHPQYFAGDPVGFVRAARWAAVVKDCCHGNAPVDYLLCDEHWAMIRFQ